MRLPTLLLRDNPNLNKNSFGHVLVIAGSASMLGACALTSLAAMRAGAGLVTAAVNQKLNLTLQKKLSPVIMTLPFTSFSTVEGQWHKFQSGVVGPGLGLNLIVQKIILKMIEFFPAPLVVDADGLNALAQKVGVLNKANFPRIITPHPKEMSRLTKQGVGTIESHRREIALSFAKKHHCIVLLKGRKTVVASWDGKVYVNQTGNVGMATAGSGDVLSGIIAAFLAQGLSAFDAAKYGAYLHGQAGDKAIKHRSKRSLIATDLLDYI